MQQDERGSSDRPDPPRIEVDPPALVRQSTMTMLFTHLRVLPDRQRGAGILDHRPVERSCRSAAHQRLGSCAHLSADDTVAIDNISRRSAQPHGVDRSPALPLQGDHPADHQLARSHLWCSAGTPEPARTTPGARPIVADTASLTSETAGRGTLRFPVSVRPSPAECDCSWTPGGRAVDVLWTRVQPTPAGCGE